jgi:hypothetical protein
LTSNFRCQRIKRYKFRRSYIKIKTLVNAILDTNSATTLQWKQIKAGCHLCNECAKRESNRHGAVNQCREVV